MPAEAPVLLDKGQQRRGLYGDPRKVMWQLKVFERCVDPALVKRKPHPVIIAEFAILNTPSIPRAALA